MAQVPLVTDPSIEFADPFDKAEHTQAEVASQWKLMWWKFKRHKMAVVGGIVVLMFYLVALFAEFVAPVHFTSYNETYVYAPPQEIHLLQNGRFSPYVFGYRFERDPASFKKTWFIDESVIIPVGFFVSGEPYKLWGFIPGNWHLFGSKNPEEPFYLLGADKSGRDVFSRIVYSSRISLTVGLAGVTISLLLGILIGGISGLVGGAVDNAIQRLIEILISVPTLPLWLALAAVVPLDWTPVKVYFMITVILSLIGWTGLARVVRSKFLALREEDFILAAILDGVPRSRLIFRHMIPSFLSHIIASVTLAIPGMILGETALSFLGLGLREPVVSWGVMLRETQKVTVLATYPWLLWPAAAVIIVVLALNFLGDGLRDAADPYQ
ncbi:MAG: ABC transporter permease [Anaerolineales bacterium]|nr:ABC transporter permease [Anaerolineales bacterium]MCB8968205.1 ABC transporter permease [Ardenticatenaceae bacterium]